MNEKGLAWAPSLPDTWEVRRTRTVMDRVRRPPHEDDGVVTAFRDGQVTLRSMRRTDGFTEAVKEIGYQGIHRGDLVVHSMDGFAGAIGVAEASGKSSPVVHAYTVHFGDARYYAHLLRTAARLGYVQSLAKGIRERSTSFDPATFAALRIPVPPPPEQLAIVDFLDQETAQIDAMIEAQDALTRLLMERRESLIHAVLNPSGEPTGRMPLKRAVRFQEGPGIMAADFRDDGIPLLRIAGVKGREVSLEGCNYLDEDMVHRQWERFRVRKGDLLISASASMGTISEVRSEDVVGAIPYTGIIRITPGVMLADYARWFFVSPDFMRQVTDLRRGATMQHFGPSHLSQMTVDLPDVGEQRRRAALLERETAQIEEVVSSAQEVTVMLRQRREALITAAVTGRIDPETGIERIIEEGAA